MGRLKTANKFRMETKFDESAIDDNSGIIVTKEDEGSEMNSDKDSEMNSDKDSEMNSENSKSESDSDGPLLIVEKILKSRNRMGCKEVKEYLLKWKGFSVEESTWEIEDNMDCKEMIREFDFEKKQKKLLKAQKDIKLQKNDYERKRMQNILEMAEFKKNLKDSATTLKQELKTKSKQTVLKCHLCSRIYKQSGALLRHKRDVHNIKTDIHNIKTQKIKTEVQAAEEYFQCSEKIPFTNNKECSEKFETYDMIKDHIAQNHTFTCSTCGESFKTKQQEKMHICLPFQCGCGKKFNNEQDLTAHECFRCKYCDERFTNTRAENAHRKRHFNEETSNYETDFLRPDYGCIELVANEICAICEDKFADENELKGHVNKIHLLSTGPKRPSRSAPPPKKLANQVLDGYDGLDRHYFIRKETKTQEAFELLLKKEGKMLTEIGFEVCGHRICMIKTPNVCGICGKKI